MPIRFWGESAKKKDRTWLVKRPPSSANWILYQNMIRVWNLMFTPATLLVIAGLVLLSMGLLGPVAGTALVFCLILLAGYYLHFRPSLGSED